MLTWDAISSGFFLGMVKFLFSAAYLETFYPELSLIQIYLITVCGALTAFNLTYWLSDFFMTRAKLRKLKAIRKGKLKKKKAFTRLNKFIVKVKMSKFGLVILSTLGVMFMSIPVGGIVLAKFYGERKWAYLLATTTILTVGLLLAIFDEQVIELFRKS